MHTFDAVEQTAQPKSQAVHTESETNLTNWPLGHPVSQIDVPIAKYFPDLQDWQLILPVPLHDSQ